MDSKHVDYKKSAMRDTSGVLADTYRGTGITWFVFGVNEVCGEKRFRHFRVLDLDL